MPKLIIPNAYELYQFDNTSLTQDEVNARYFYNLRFLWLLEPGDVIILPQQPAKGFLLYLAKMKQINPESLHLVILDKKHMTLHSGALSDPELIKQLRDIMTIPSQWQIQTCYFNVEILALSKKLHLTIDPEWEEFIKAGLVQQMNSKMEFRKISESNHLPIPEGNICFSPEELEVSLKNILSVTGQVIIKQEYNASGKGNIGVTTYENQSFVGVINIIVIRENESIKKVSEQVWFSQIHSCNKSLIIEVYYPNKGTFTAQYWVPARGKIPTLLNYSEIMMESRWVGIQIPPQILSHDEIGSLVAYSKKFADILQNLGYQGYLCCDAILTNERKILFTEINVRPGAETHAYVLARHLLGEGCENKMVILTRSSVKTNSFLKSYKMLKEESLLLSNEQATGFAFLTVDENNTHQVEYLIAAPDLVAAQTLEAKITKLLA